MQPIRLVSEDGVPLAKPRVALPNSERAQAVAEHTLLPTAPQIVPYVHPLQPVATSFEDCSWLGFEELHQEEYVPDPELKTLIGVVGLYPLKYQISNGFSCVLDLIQDGFAQSYGEINRWIFSTRKATTINQRRLLQEGIGNVGRGVELAMAQLVEMHCARGSGKGPFIGQMPARQIDFSRQLEVLREARDILGLGDEQLGRVKECEPSQKDHEVVKRVVSRGEGINRRIALCAVVNTLILILEKKPKLLSVMPFDEHINNSRLKTRLLRLETESERLIEQLKTFFKKNAQHLEKFSEFKKQCGLFRAKYDEMIPKIAKLDCIEIHSFYRTLMNEKLSKRGSELLRIFDDPKVLSREGARDLRSLVVSHVATYESVIQEGILLILDNVALEKKYALFFWFDAVHDVTSAILHYPYGIITDRLMRQDDANLSTDERQIVEFLQKLWLTNVKRLTTCLHSCQNISKIRRARAKSNKLEYALFMRDSLEICFVLSKEIEQAKTSMQEYRSRLQSSQALLRLYNDIENVFEMHFHAVEAIINRFHSSLVEKSLINIHEMSKKSAESTYQMLIDECSPKPKKKKKARRQKPREAQEGKAPPVSPTDDEEVEAVRQQVQELTLNPTTPEDDIRRAMKVLKASDIIEGPDREFRATWRNGVIKNFKVALDQMMESSTEGTFSRNKIFGESEMVRKLLESALELALAHFPIVGDDRMSVLRKAHENGHQLHLHVRELLKAKEALPENVRRVIQNMKAAPQRFSYANTSIHYPFSTAIHQTLSPQARPLLGYLLQVDKESRNEQADDNARKALLFKHQDAVKMCVAFLRELLQACASPTYSFEPIPSFEKETEQSVAIEDLVEEESAIDELSAMMSLPSGALSHPVVASTEDALFALDEALIWTSIRRQSPVEGELDLGRRFNERNAALQNVRLYIDLLKEKLLNRELKVYDFCSGALNLLRRAHKEFCIAALYHGGYVEEGMHVVEARGLRKENSPKVLYEVLTSLSTHTAKLPEWYHNDLYWMHKLHITLSYPTPLQQNRSKETEIDHMLRRIKELAKERKKLIIAEQDTQDFILVGPKNTRYSVQENRAKMRSLIDEVAYKKVFPSISQLLLLLRYAIPAHKGLGS